MPSLFPIYFMLMQVSAQFPAICSHPLTIFYAPQEGAPSNLRTPGLNELQIMNDW